MAKPQWLTLEDHAFASGPVFRRPANWLVALRKTRSLSGARLLQKVWNQFDQNAHCADTMNLSLTSRLINRNAKDAVRISGDTALRAIIRIERNGRLSINHSVYAGDNCLISAFEEVTIGEGTLLAHGVQIFDNDSHPTDAADRMADFRKRLGHKLPRPITIGSAPVTIGRRCWIGLNSIVMKGVTIGDDTIVAAGSVVVKDLPSGVLAAGNPARVIRVITAGAVELPSLTSELANDTLKS